MDWLIWLAEGTGQQPSTFWTPTLTIAIYLTWCQLRYLPFIDLIEYMSLLMFIVSRTLPPMVVCVHWLLSIETSCKSASSILPGSSSSWNWILNYEMWVCCPLSITLLGPNLIFLFPRPSRSSLVFIKANTASAWSFSTTSRTIYVLTSTCPSTSKSCTSTSGTEDLSSTSGTAFPWQSQPWLHLSLYYSPYLSADLRLMANCFNTSLSSLEDELTALILEGQIQARIDSHNKASWCRFWWTN